MQRLFNLVVIASASLALSWIPAHAEDSHNSHHPKAEAQKTYSGKGEVVVLDQAAGKVKLKHEAIPELGWPAMTMFFPVADKSLLSTLKVGDKVEFEFVKTGGAPQITQIKVAK